MGAWEFFDKVFRFTEFDGRILSKLFVILGVLARFSKIEPIFSVS